MIQFKKANEIKTYLENFDFIKSCKIAGSLESGHYDKYSDIDLKIDVSGSDNGKVLLMIPYLLSKEFPIIYTVFAPRFAPDLYVVSFGIKDMNIFHFIDIECTANPHVESLSKDDIRLLTNMNNLNVKLLIGLLKKYLRNDDVKDELEFFSKKKIERKNVKESLIEEFKKLKIKADVNIISIIDSSLELLKS